MRRTKIRKKSKTKLALAKEKLWKTLKQVISIRDGDTCISCGAKGIHGHNKHGGHFIPSASCGGFLRYDIRNVWVQCATCNLYHSGAGAEYTIELQKRFGKKFVEQLIADKNVSIKLDIHYITALDEYYKTLLTKTHKQLLRLTKNYKGFYNKQS